jgi:hypothetical protein
VNKNVESEREKKAKEREREREREDGRIFISNHLHCKT